MRIPDAASISKARVSELSDATFPVVPDLAVEVISPSESARRTLDKARVCLQAGSRLVEAQVVDVHRLEADDSLNIQTINMEGVLDGGSVLPGFTLPVQDIFPK